LNESVQNQSGHRPKGKESSKKKDQKKKWKNARRRNHFPLRKEGRTSKFKSDCGAVKRTAPSELPGLAMGQNERGARHFKSKIVGC